MSNSYALYKNNTDDAVVTLDEEEGLFTLDMSYNDSFGIFITRGMSPQEMAQIFISGLNFCASSMKANEIEEMILAQLKDK